MIALVSKLNTDIYFFFISVDPSQGVTYPQIQLRCGGRPCPQCKNCSDWYYNERNNKWNPRDGYTCNGIFIGPIHIIYGIIIHPVCKCNR